MTEAAADHSNREDPKKGETANGEAENGETENGERIHPPIGRISDALSFRLVRLVGINERSGGRWSRRVFGLSLNEWRVMGLAHELAPATAAQIGKMLQMDKGQVSRIVQTLVEKGYLVARPSARDARVAILDLTDAGRVLHDRVLAYAAIRNEMVVSSLSREECATFMRLLEKITAHNEDLLERAETGA